MEVALMPFGSLLAALEGIHDPRRPQGQRYSLSHLLLFAVLAGATSYQKIITFIAVQRDRLNTAFGACLRRAPAVNALRRLLERDDLEAAFRRHADELNGTVQVTGKRTIALDGKALLMARRCAAASITGTTGPQLMCSAPLPVTPPSSPPGGGRGARRDPGRADADGGPGPDRRAVHRRCPALSEGQLHAGRRNGLLVQVKQNQPTLHETLARLCAEHHPFDSHRRHRQEHRLVEVFDTSWTPSGSR